MKDLSIYVHIPFCKHKCGYCDFLSFEEKEDKNIEQYIDFLLKEIDLYYEKIKDREIQSIFFGGGTPSILGDIQLNRILSHLKKFNWSRDCEVTLEANPESFVNLNAKKLLENGFNRLSLGVQSGSDKLLKIMERIHSSEVAKEAFLQARKAGFKNINVDFISSVPGENLDDILKTLQWIFEMNPDHVSLYSLILEEESKFYSLVKSGQMALLEEEKDRIHVHYYKKELEKMGYKQYEISNYSRPGKECKQNIRYWTLKEYIGFGLGAHSNLKDIRWWNQRNSQIYFENIQRKSTPVKEREKLSVLDRTNEFVMLRLRMNKGIMGKEILPNGNKFSDYFQREIKENMKKGLLEKAGDYYFLTCLGQDLSNQVETSFFQLS